MVFVFLFVTYFTLYDNLQVHPCCCKWLYLISFLWLSCIPLCMYNISSLSIHLSVTFRLLACLDYCKQCCQEHWSSCIFSNRVFSGYIPQSRIAESYDNSTFSFLKGLFSIVTSPIYIPPSSMGGFPFLHIFSSICYLQNF